MFRLATGLNTEHLISIRIIQLAASADGGWRLEFFNLRIDDLLHAESNYKRQKNVLRHRNLN